VAQSMVSWGPINVFAEGSRSDVHTVLILIILNLTFSMQVVLSATSSRLHCVLGDFHMSAENLVQNFF